MNNTEELIKIIDRKKVTAVFKGWWGLLRLGLFLLLLPAAIYIFQFLGKELDVTQFYRLSSKEYSFFSGNTVGSYYQIAEALKTRNGNSKIKLTSNNSTDGGYSNPIKVLTNKNSFGFVEEDVFPKSDVIRNLITYVTPIYVERMHFLYNKTKIHVENPTLTINTEETLLKAISDNIVSVGVIGGGTNVLSDYIINELNEQIKSLNDTNISLIGKKVSRYPTDIACTMLEKGEISAMFFIGGAPNPRIDDLLKSKGIGLVNIESSFTSQLNRKYNLELKNANFKDKYNLTQNVLTFGTYCFLITNKSTPPSDIELFLKNLENLTHDTSVDIRIRNILSEFSPVNSYETSQSEIQEKTWSNFWLFSLSVLTAWASMFYFAYKLLTKWQVEANFDTVLNEIAERIPKIEQILSGDENKFTLPIISDEPKVIVDKKIVPSISDLFALRRVATSKFSEKAIGEDQYEFFMQRNDELVGKFRKELFLRLYDYLLINKGKGGLSEDDLRRYLTGEYLEFENYEILIKTLKK